MNKMIDVVDKLMNMDGVPLSRLEVLATRRLQTDPRQASLSSLTVIHWHLKQFPGYSACS